MNSLSQGRAASTEGRAASAEGGGAAAGVEGEVEGAEGEGGEKLPAGNVYLGEMLVKLREIVTPPQVGPRQNLGRGRQKSISP